MRHLVLASNNKGKLREFNELLRDSGFDVTPQGAYFLDSVPETGLSFVENAILKARYAAQHTGLPALADDSGLEVDALQGAPGIFSARYAGPDASDSDNCELLLGKLADVPEDRLSARFQCVIVYMAHAADPTPMICQGTWEGRITLNPKGDNGFGYDPIFWLPEHQCTAAELDSTRKNEMSHRGQALRALQAKLAANGK